MSKISDTQIADSIELLGKILYSLVEDRKSYEAESLKDLLLVLKTLRKENKRGNGWIREK